MPNDRPTATLVRWYHDDGALVRGDDPLCELEMGMATVDVPASKAGRLRRLAAEGDRVTSDSEIARIDPV